MRTQRENLHSRLRSFASLLLLLPFSAFGLNTDGVILLSLKYSILSDPLSVIQNWSYDDETPCSWNGITCEAPNDDSFRVTAVNLPNSQLLGSLPSDLGMIQHLQILNLSNNSFNGSLPISLFNHSKLRSLDLSNNMISGKLPVTIGRLQSLEFLNLSENSLAGNLPERISSLRNLTIVSLKGNYFNGNLPGGFQYVQSLDISSNLIGGPLPSDFGGSSLKYLNLSYNRLSGQIPPEFSEKIPGNATMDLSFNNLTGEIPESRVFTNQDENSFSGNPNLCGGSIKNLCETLSSPPAIVAIPKNFDSTPEQTQSRSGLQEKKSGFSPATIVAIVIGDIAGIGILAVIFFYAYQSKKKSRESKLNREANTATDVCSSLSSSSSESKGFTKWSCLRKRNEDEESSYSTDSEPETKQKNVRQTEKEGTLVTVDGDKQLEIETLLKASAYILGASGSSIMYKAVLEDGTTLAVRRIGENNVDRFKDFESRVRVVAKLVHPNLVRVRAFYWGADEKLIVYDFVPNGSLANARYRKGGSSPCHLPWEARLRVARGVARGLAYLHEKKHVHGNLKPSNILLGADMEPKIGDFGLEKIITGDTSSKGARSARNFGSKRSTASRDSFQDFTFGPSPSPSPSSMGFISPYQAPETFRSLKSNPKWDVYSFGVILLELLTGKFVVTDEMGQNLGLVGDDKNRAVKMADPTIRAELEGKEEALISCLRLGQSCASSVPQKRPSMKEVLQVLEKIPSSSSSLFFYGH